MFVSRLFIYAYILNYTNIYAKLTLILLTKLYLQLTILCNNLRNCYADKVCQIYFYCTTPNLSVFFLQQHFLSTILIIYAKPCASTHKFTVMLLLKFLVQLYLLSFVQLLHYNFKQCHVFINIFFQLDVKNFLTNSLIRYTKLPDLLFTNTSLFFCQNLNTTTFINYANSLLYYFTNLSVLFCQNFNNYLDFLNYINNYTKSIYAYILNYTNIYANSDVCKYASFVFLPKR